MAAASFLGHVQCALKNHVPLSRLAGVCTKLEDHRNIAGLGTAAQGIGQE